MSSVDRAFKAGDTIKRITSGGEAERCASHFNDVHEVDDAPRSISPTTPTPESPLFEPMDDNDSTPMDDLAPYSESPSPLSERASPVPPPIHVTALDGLKRARAIKAEISTSLRILQPKKSAALRRRVEEDPENQLIKTLRQDHHMNWQDIANHLNNERLKRGEPGNLTSPAVYSRFVRNGPRVAAALGEVGFDPKDYMHLRHPTQTASSSVYTTGNGPSLQLGIGAGRKRVRHEGNEEQELRHNVRARRSLAEDARDLETEGMSEMLVRAVAVVERNFWTLVADELQRGVGGEFAFDARACESRYHAI